MRHSIGLDVAIIVFAGPNIAAFPLERRSNHIVDEAMLIVQASGFKIGLEFLVVDALENIFELAIIGFEDGVLGGEIHRIVHAEAIVKGGPGEILNGLSEVIHAHNDTAVFGKTHYFMLDGFGAIIGGEGEGDGASTGDFEVGGAVLVAKGVTACLLYTSDAADE